MKKKEKLLQEYNEEIERECIQKLLDYYAEESKLRDQKRTDFDVEGYDGFIRRVIRFRDDYFYNKEPLIKKQNDCTR